MLIRTRQTTFANSMLMLVAIAWGFTFPVIKAWAGDVDAGVFVIARFSVAALVLLPFIKWRTLLSSKTMLAGLVLGLINSGVYLLQTISLNYISAARCAFLTGTVVIWMPLLRVLLSGVKITLLDLSASALCLFGLWILTGAEIHSIGIGDWLVFTSEAFFALSILYLDHINDKGHHPFALTFYQICFTCLVPILFCLKTQPSLLPLFHVHAISAVILCAAFATTFALLMQVHYQRYTSAEMAALIYATEPLWAAIFANSLFGEALTISLLVGGAIMISSVILPEMKFIIGWIRGEAS